MTSGALLRPCAAAAAAAGTDVGLYVGMTAQFLVKTASVLSWPINAAGI